MVIMCHTAVVVALWTCNDEVGHDPCPEVWKSIEAMSLTEEKACTKSQVDGVRMRKKRRAHSSNYNKSDVLKFDRVESYKM